MDSLIQTEVQEEITVSQFTDYFNTQLSPDERIQARYLLSIIDFKKFGNLTISQFKKALSK